MRRDWAARYDLDGGAMSAAEIARVSGSAIGFALHELAAAPDRDADAERADPRLIDLAREIGHARTHLALAARKAAEIMHAPVTL